MLYDVYHNQFFGDFGLGVDLTVEIVVLLDPIHGTNWNINSFVASGTVIV